MDRMDIQILEILQRDNRTPSEKIASAVGLSATAVQRRIRRMRDDKVITQDVAVLSPTALGRNLTLIVEVALTKGPSCGVDEFKQAVRMVPQIMQCYQVTGRADFVLIVTARDMDDYLQFTRRFFDENPHVSRVESSVVMQPVKVGLSLPLSVN